MADIDKPLPNTKTTVELPGEVEIEEAIKENVEGEKLSESSKKSSTVSSLNENEIK